MPYGLKPETLERLNQVFKKHEQIDEVILYGSRAKGNYTEGSDIDLTLQGKDLDNRALQKIRIEIDDLLLPWIVDLSILSNIDNEELIAHIDRVGKIIYKKTDT